MTEDDYIKKAELWAASLWRETLSRWSGRSGQDKNYRQNVINPAVLSLLHERFPDQGIRILELGCGDGVLLNDPKWRELVDNGGAYLGIDISAELIGKARHNHIGENIDFIIENLADPTLAVSIVSRNESWDCVLSIFMLQEIPNLEPVLGNLDRIMSGGCPAVLIAVHPDFADWLMKEERMRKVDYYNDVAAQKGIESGEDPWRWAGYYPIVDEPLEVFYLPYFHRSLSDYRSLMDKFGFTIEKIMELPEKEYDLPLLVKSGISPFTPFGTNIYWPRIGEAPSSIAIIARKDKKSEQK